MPTLDQLRTLALSLPEVTEEPHFEKTSFRVRKKIFATYDGGHNRLSLKLSPVNQDVLSSMDRAAVYPVPNKWGQQGWTFVELARVNELLLIDAVKLAYCEVAPARLAGLGHPDSFDPA